MLRRLRIKFVAVVMVIVTATLCLIFSMVYRYTADSLAAESVSMMQSVSSGPPQMGPPGSRPGQVRLPHFSVQVGPDGEMWAIGEGPYDLTDREFLKTVVEAALAVGGETGALKEYGLRFLRAETPVGQRLVFADMSSELAALSSLARVCIFTGILCFAVLFGVSILLARWIVGPVDRAWRQQRQFVADASHELKTPLAVIMANAELLQPQEGGGERGGGPPGRILTMARQMRELVERLLELARADSGQSKAAFARLDLSELVERTALPFEPILFEKGLELSGQVQPGVFVDGDSRQLEQMVGILLDNAGKYAAGPGTVELSLRQTDKRRCLLSVSNACEAMDREELKNIFKRFYRADKARSRDGSFGLGLAIAESIVTEHKGRAWAEWNSGRITFLIELPAKTTGRQTIKQEVQE